MEPTTEAGGTQPLELKRQSMTTTDKACTAYAFINALRLAGATASPQDEETLITLAQNGKPLENPDREKIAEKLGISYNPLSNILFDSPKDPNAILQLINGTLSQSPVVFTVSRYLAKRPETSMEDKNNFHAVTARLAAGKIEVIDPYVPDSPEVFDPTTPADRQRFLAWFISPYIQNSGTKSKDAIIEGSAQAFATEQSFGTAIRAVASLHQTYSLGNTTYAKT